MEGILILVIFAAVNIFSAWQKQKKKYEAEKRGKESSSDPLAPIPMDPLQELLRKFEEAQKKHSQNADEDSYEHEELEEEIDDDFDEEVIPEEPAVKPVASEVLPKETHQRKFVLNESYSEASPQNKPSFSTISSNHKEPSEKSSSAKPEEKSILEKAAYFAITQNFISEKLLMEELQLGRTMAASLIQKMEYLGICGKNMGETDRSVLIENETELKNVLKRAYDLNLHQNPVSFKGRHKRKFVFSKEEAEKGVIWSKILDEPRFKKHWTPQSR